GYLGTGPYRIPNQALESLCVYTNKPPAGAYRAFGTPQLCWAYESQMDDIARELGVDPVEYRRRHLLADGERFVTGQIMESVGSRACLDQVAEALDLHPGWDGSGDVRDVATVRAKGIACTMKSTMTPSISAATVRMDADGSVQVGTSAVEIGQGALTILAQI